MKAGFAVKIEHQTTLPEIISARLERPLDIPERTSHRLQPVKLRSQFLPLLSAKLANVGCLMPQLRQLLSQVCIRGKHENLNE